MIHVVYGINVFGIMELFVIPPRMSSYNACGLLGVFSNEPLCVYILYSASENNQHSPPGVRTTECMTCTLCSALFGVCMRNTDVSAAHSLSLQQGPAHDLFDPGVVGFVVGAALQIPRGHAHHRLSVSRARRRLHVGPLGRHVRGSSGGQAQLGACGRGVGMGGRRPRVRHGRAVLLLLALLAVDVVIVPAARDAYFRLDELQLGGADAAHQGHVLHFPEAADACTVLHDGARDGPGDPRQGHELLLAGRVHVQALGVVRGDVREAAGRAELAPALTHVRGVRRERAVAPQVSTHDP